MQKHDSTTIKITNVLKKSAFVDNHPNVHRFPTANLFRNKILLDILQRQMNTNAQPSTIFMISTDFHVSLHFLDVFFWLRNCLRVFFSVLFFMKNI